MSRVYTVTVRTPQGVALTYSGIFAASFEAIADALDRSGPDCRISVKPAQMRNERAHGTATQNRREA